MTRKEFVGKKIKEAIPLLGDWRNEDALKSILNDAYEALFMETDDLDARSATYISVVFPHLSIRTMNCLRYANIVTIEQLITQPLRDIFSWRNFGRRSFDELRKGLLEIGRCPEDWQLR